MLKVGTGSPTSWTELPTPKNVNYSYNKIWSKNTGRLDSGYFVGDLIAIKRKYEITFPALSTSELTTVRNSCANQYAKILITDVDGGNAELDVYFGDVTVRAYSWKNGIKYAIDCKVSAIER